MGTVPLSGALTQSDLLHAWQHKHLQLSHHLPYMAGRVAPVLATLEAEEERSLEPMSLREALEILVPKILK